MAQKCVLVFTKGKKGRLNLIANTMNGKWWGTRDQYNTTQYNTKNGQWWGVREIGAYFEYKGKQYGMEGGGGKYKKASFNSAVKVRAQFETFSSPPICSMLSGL